jgi:glycine cleavage system H protein
MNDAKVPDDLRYTKDHEWARPDGADIAVGVTAFAVEQLGDVTLVSLDVKVGDTVAAGKAFGTIESVKTLSDLFAPLAGKVVRINDALTSKPELVNEDCYGKAWMIALAPTDPQALNALMDAGAYREHVKAEAH